MSVLVAVSGGPDSVALLHLLHELAPSWRLSLSVVHCNYGLRGRESQRDETFVRDLCQRLGIPCHVRRLSIAAAARPRRPVSLQTRARALRYRAFDKLAARDGIDRVALGHTADDQAETVLQCMLRGAGTTGLSGMPIMRNDRFIRPLLTVAKSEVLAYLEARRLPYRTDSSNARPLYRRNRIRLELMPLLKKLNPAIVRTLTRQADLLRADEEYLAGQSARAFAALAVRTASGEVVLNRAELLSLPLALQRRLLREAVRMAQDGVYAPSLATVTMILNRVLLGRSGAGVSLRGVTVSRDVDRIVVARLPSHPVTAGVLAPAVGPVTPTQSRPATLVWTPSGQAIRLRMTPAAPKFLGPAERRSTRLVIDADRITPRIQLRVWHPGDWFCPSGMGGHRKKVHDFWIDAKIPRKVRAATPVMVAPEGILWIVGHRADERFRPTAATSRLLIADVTGAGTHSISKEP